MLLVLVKLLIGHREVVQLLNTTPSVVRSHLLILSLKNILRYKITCCQIKTGKRSSIFPPLFHCLIHCSFISSIVPLFYYLIHCPSIVLLFHLYFIITSSIAHPFCMPLSLSHPLSIHCLITSSIVHPLFYYFIYISSLPHPLSIHFACHCPSIVIISSIINPLSHYLIHCPSIVLLFHLYFIITSSIVLPFCMPLSFHCQSIMSLSHRLSIHCLITSSHCPSIVPLSHPLFSPVLLMMVLTQWKLLIYIVYIVLLRIVTSLTH